MSGDRESLFPSALPYPEVQSEQRGTIVGTTKANLWARSYLNFWVAWSNFVILGCPDCRGAVSEPLESYGCGRRMRSFTDRLLGEVEEFMSDVSCTGEVACDGKRASLEESLELLAASNASYGAGTLPGGVSSKLSAAMPVTASRIAIPEVAGTVDPRECLDDEKAQILDQLGSFRLPPDQWKEVVKACHRVSEGEESALVRKLLNSKMVTLVPESELPRDHSGELMGGGFFCVAKNETEDRLIFDRRPENATMQRLRWSELPSAACFCRVLLQEDEYLRGSGDDLRNYYYALALPPNWIKYNSVGRRVDPSIVREWGGDPNISYRAAMRVLGMGDTNACDIAQAVHVHILSKAGLLSDDTRLTYGESVPQGPLLEGAYLDDLLIVYRQKMGFKIPLDGTFKPPQPQATDLDMQRTLAAEDAYQQAGLQRAVHKSFRACEKFKAWGASIDGIQGTVGAPLGVRQQVWWLILQVVQQGQCSKQALQRVLGYVCFIFQFRREFYSLQHHIYKYIDGMKDDCNYKLPAHILDELRSMAVHIPFSTWHMRKKLHTSILATDATPSSGGATRADLPPQLGALLWNQCEVRGEAVRLDRDMAFSDVLEGKQPKEPSQLASAVAESLHWHVVSSYHFRHTAHINLQEARALRREIVSMAEDPQNFGRVQLCLNDSRVVIGAVAKGRSSSFRLNGILRSMVPFLTLAQIALGLLWVETDSNAADYPSRFKLLPPPRSVPRWLGQLGVPNVRLPGFEVFAGSARITKAFIEAGWAMLDPVDILWGSDVFATWVTTVIASGRIGWLWLAPPCSSFSALRNLDPGGPLRPKGKPEGNESNEEVKRGNALWRRALELANLAYNNGIPFFIEHPRNSKAWLMKETWKHLLNKPGVKSWLVDWCAFDDDRKGELPNLKATRIVGTGGWMDAVVKRCPGNHQHGKPLRGSRAKLAGAYPIGFCRELARSYSVWYGEAPQCRAVSVLPSESN